MRVLVCGGRDYDDQARLYAMLDELAPSFVIEGWASGADRMAWQWRKRRGVPGHSYVADWGKHGKAAGPIRNQRMIDEGKPDKVIAFPGGRGTADMVRRARAAGIEVLEIPAHD